MYREILFLIVLLLIPTAIVPTADAQPAFPYTIKGCVEKNDGDPVTGVKVTVENMAIHEKRSDDTDDKGCYQVNTGREFQVSDGDELRISLTYDEEYEEFENVDTSEAVLTVNFIVGEIPDWTPVWIALGVLAISLAGIYLYLKRHPVDSDNV